MEKVFAAAFEAETERLLELEDLWKSRKRPEPMVLAAVLAAEAGELDAEAEDQLVPTTAQSARLFLSAARALHGSTDRVFDKDDAQACQFVTAATNLRAVIFEMAPMTPFKVKEVAGNIISAIASTNAIIAGFIVVEAVKVLTEKFDTCRMQFSVKNPGGRRSNALLQGNPMSAPNPKCYVCGTASCTVALDTSEVRAALRKFNSKAVQRRGTS